MAKQKPWLILLGGLLLMIALAGIAVAAGETMERSVIAGGGRMSDANYTLRSAFAQPVAGTVSDGKTLCSGFACGPGASVVTSPAGGLHFDPSTYTAAPGVTSMTITVTRVGGTTGTVTVGYATANDTAISGVDYVQATGTLTFNEGVATQTFSVTLLDNPAATTDRSLNLILSNPTGGAELVSPTTATLLIQAESSNPSDDQEMFFPFLERQQ